MKYNLKKISDSKIEIEITIPSDEMDVFWQKARKDISQKRQIKGFRPGKAPAELSVSDEELYNEVVNLAIEESYPEIIKKEKIEILGKADIEIKKIAPKNDFVCKISVSVIPDFDLSGYKDIAKDILKEKKEVEVKEEEIENSIEWIRKSHSKTIEVERESRKDDLIELEVVGLTGDNKPSIQSFVLGKGQNFLAGFEEQIVGMKAGEKKEFSLKVSNDYWDKEKAGKEILLKVELKKVQEIQLPEITDDWAKTLGDFDSVEGLRNSLREGIMKEKEMKERERLRIKILEKLAESVKVEIPEELILAEVENKIKDIENMVSGYNLSFEEYLKRIGKDENSLREEIKPEAKKSVLKHLILRKIIEKEKIEVKEEEIEKETEIFLRKYSEEEVAKIDKSNLYSYIKNILSNEKVFQILENI
jgi:trigger factor